VRAAGAITNAFDAGVLFGTRADPGPLRRSWTTEHYDQVRGNLDQHGIHFFTAYVAGV
jgi:hypothetical protein